MKHLGLDWDGTATDFPKPFSILAQLFDRTIIITVNPTVTVEKVSELLGLEQSKIEVVICPTDHLQRYADWKADQCELLAVTIMFDDDGSVVDSCRDRGIPVIGVAYG